MQQCIFMSADYHIIELVVMENLFPLLLDAWRKLLLDSIQKSMLPVILAKVKLLYKAMV